MSRFLVRIRQFWTRDRLVPVLGITALLLFGINSYKYLSSFFGDRPVVATHITINGASIDGFADSENEPSRHFFWQFDNAKRHADWHHEHNRQSRIIAWELARDKHRTESELSKMLRDRLLMERELQELKLQERNLLDQHRIEIKNHVLEFDLENLDSDDDDDEKVIIMKKDGENAFEITINGKKIEILEEKEI